MSLTNSILSNHILHILYPEKSAGIKVLREVRTLINVLIDQRYDVANWLWDFYVSWRIFEMQKGILGVLKFDMKNPYCRRDSVFLRLKLKSNQ